MDLNSPETSNESLNEVVDEETTDNIAHIQNDLENRSKEELWDQIGFHRPLAGFWHNLIFQIGILLIPSLVAVYVFKLIYPFPTSNGYRTAFSGIFVLVFQAFDLGTVNTISRFIADENIKSPGKMVQYIQYFIWYQAITGLLQITLISYWALYIAKNSELAYGIWIVLLIITKQWPGFPGVFKGVLNALQMFGKSNVIEFVQGEGIQIFTEIAFCLLGKWYGQTHPEIGPLLGIAIGSVFGLYLDDVIATFIAAYFLADSLKHYGITFGRFFHIEFDKELVKKCLVFGIKMGIPSLFTAGTSLLSLALCLQYIPQYTTFAALRALAISLVATTDRLVYQNFTPIYSEAYQNHKPKLCTYYNAHAMRFFFINSGFAISIMIMVISMFERIFIGVGLDLYLLTIPFLIPSLIYRCIRPYERYPGNILVAAHKPTELMVLNISIEGLKMLAWYLTIVVFKVQDLGIAGVIYALTLTEVPVFIIKIIVSMRYINKRIFRIKFMTWQTFVVPALATAILFIVFTIFRLTAMEALWEWNFWGTIILGIVMLAILVIFLYFPLTAALGGWDDNSVRDFKAAVRMAGLSRIIIKPATILVLKIVKHSKLHNKFKFDETEAFVELKELISIRDANREKFTQDNI